MTRGTRTDLGFVSDFTEFWAKNDGCEHSASCLTCPLAECRWDNPIELQEKLRARRDEMVWRWRKEGMSVIDIAKAQKISTRTVDRILQAGEPENSPSDDDRPALPSSEGAGSDVRPSSCETGTKPVLSDPSPSSRVIYESV